MMQHPGTFHHVKCLVQFFTVRYVPLDKRQVVYAKFFGDPDTMGQAADTQVETKHFCIAAITGNCRCLPACPASCRQYLYLLIKKIRRVVVGKHFTEVLVIGR